MTSRRVQVLLCVIVIVCLCFEEAAATGIDVQPIAALRQLSPEAVAGEPAVRVRGVVTWRDDWNYILQEGDSGIFIFLRAMRNRGLTPDFSLLDDLVPGAEVEVEGRLIPGGFSPAILATASRVIGSAKTPEPRGTSPRRFFSGADDCLLVEIAGVVRAVRESADAIDLSMAVDGKPFVVRVEGEAMQGAFGDLVDTEVRVAGVAMTRFNTRGELTMPSLAVGTLGGVTVIAARRFPPFEAPMIPLRHLNGFRAEPHDGHMVRIEGTVSHAVAAAELHLQDGVTGVRVSTDSSGPFTPGDRVEAAGFVDTSGRVAGLCHAVVRRIAAGSPPRPVAITPDAILETNLVAVRSYTMANPGDYEGCLITFPATLLEKQPTHTGGSLILAAGKTTVVAILSDADEGRLRGLMPGSEVRLTGIAHTDWEPPADAWGSLPRVSERMRLRVRSADDVVVLREPSWWTPRRLAILAGSLAAVAAGAFLWGVLLRRQAVRLAQRIAEEIRLRRDAAVEFEATLRERNRLALNLHDTVLQTVTGIGYQVAACKDDEGRPSVDVDRHFGVVERMVTHAMRQLRGTVWALKAAAPSGRPFPAALADLAARLGEEHDAVIDVGVAETTPTLDEVVAGNLLLIAQESLLNALRHADASAIAVRFGPVAPLTVAGPPAVELTVRDDGHGFDPASRPGAREGHFGIEGMCERVERLGGSITIESQPGSGTTVVVRLPASVTTPADRTGRMEHEAASRVP
jgi:signal transduction histidine kinase